MNVIVLIKQVPDTAEIKIDFETGRLIRNGVPSIINPFDKNALEAAVQLKEKHGGMVTALSMGPTQAKNALKEALSLGADNAYLVTDRLFGGSDTYATSYILSEAIKKLGSYDIILAGKQAIDGDTGQTATGIAQHLDVPQLTYTIDICIEDKNTVVAKRQVDEGVEIVEAKTPVVCTVTKDINKPRYATIKSKIDSLKTEIKEITAKDLSDIDKSRIGLKGSPTRVKKTFTPQIKPSGEMIKADTAREATIKLVDRLVAEKVL